jgi:exodeoxyribonuclease VII small subunit
MAKKTFEMAMKQLEQIVQDLETGDMPLEKAIKKFEEGIQISKYCSEKLDESEKRITLLMRDSDGKNASEIPFATEDEISGENGDKG